MTWKILAVLALVLALAAPAIAQDEPQIDDAITEDVEESEPSGPVQIVVVEPPTPIVIVVTATPAPTSEPTVIPTPQISPTPTLADRDVMAATLRADVVNIMIVPLSTSPRGGYTYHEIWMWFTFTNTGAQDIRAYSGVVHINDQFGRELKVADLTIDDHPLIAGAAVSPDRYELHLNQFITGDVRISQSSKDSLNITFEPRSIIFSDGRRIGTPASLR